jgi:hypothetical protein
MCRCGLERSRLEAAGYKFEAPPAPIPATTIQPQSNPRTFGWAGRLIGYRPDPLAIGWRLALAVLFIVSVVGVGNSMARLPRTPLSPTRENVDITARLEDYTRNAGADSPNTIPAFLALRGVVGVIGADGAPTELVRSIDEAELRQAFCSMSVARRIRFRFPGFYTGWSDARLERAVLQKYPEYQEGVCVLSTKLDASATDIVKYTLKQRSALAQTGLWALTLLTAAVFAFAVLNVYFRFVVPILPVPSPETR